MLRSPIECRCRGQVFDGERRLHIFDVKRPVRFQGDLAHLFSLAWPVYQKNLSISRLKTSLYVTEKFQLAIATLRVGGTVRVGCQCNWKIGCYMQRCIRLYEQETNLCQKNKSKLTREEKDSKKDPQTRKNPPSWMIGHMLVNFRFGLIIGGKMAKARIL